MPILVKSIGIIIACLTVIVAFSPDTARSMVAFMKEGKRLYIAAGVRIIIGALLIVASFYCAAMWVVMTIGIITFLSGAIAAGVGLPRLIAYVDWWLAKTNNVIRALAAIGFIFGVALIYAA